MIEVQHISRSYGTYKALDDVSFRLRNGRVYGLVGPVGCGRSTLLRIMSGSLVPDEGTVTAGGYDILKKPKAVRRQIGCLPQGGVLLRGMTVKGFLEFIAEAKGIHGEMAIRQVNEVIVLCGLEAVRSRYTDSLTPDMKIRAGIAQTLLGNPDNIVLDEPTAGLDDDKAAAVLTLIRRIGEKKTVLISGERTDALLSVCDSLLTLEGGKLVGEEAVEHPAPVPEETTAGDAAADDVTDEADGEAAGEPADGANDCEVTDEAAEAAAEPADADTPAEKEDSAE